MIQYSDWDYNLQMTANIFAFGWLFPLDFSNVFRLNCNIIYIFRSLTWNQSLLLHCAFHRVI